MPFFLSTYVETWIYIGISGSSVTPGARFRAFVLQFIVKTPFSSTVSSTACPQGIHCSASSQCVQPGCWCCPFTFQSYSPSTHDPQWAVTILLQLESPVALPDYCSCARILLHPYLQWHMEFYFIWSHQRVFYWIVQEGAKKWGCGEFTFLWHFPLKQIVCGPWHPVESFSNKPIFLLRVTFIFCECFIYMYAAHHVHVQCLQRLIEMSGPLEVELGL